MKEIRISLSTLEDWNIALSSSLNEFILMTKECQVEDRQIKSMAKDIIEDITLIQKAIQGMIDFIHQ